MDNDQSAKEPLTSRPNSGKTPVNVSQQHQSSYSQITAQNANSLAQQQPIFGHHQTHNNWQPSYVPQPPLVFGPTNTKATCPHCKANIKTAIEYSVTTRTHRTAIACCAFCCCCLPYCLKSARNIDHYCPNCQFYLGTYER